MLKEFHTLSDGTEFTRNGSVFVKIPGERVNCCTVLNALNKETNEKVMVPPLDNVEVADVVE